MSLFAWTADEIQSLENDTIYLDNPLAAAHTPNAVAVKSVQFKNSFCPSDGRCNVCPNLVVLPSNIGALTRGPFDENERTCRIYFATEAMREHYNKKGFELNHYEAAFCVGYYYTDLINYIKKAAALNAQLFKTCPDLDALDLYEITLLNRVAEQIDNLIAEAVVTFNTLYLAPAHLRFMAKKHELEGLEEIAESLIIRFAFCY